MGVYPTPEQGVDCTPTSPDDCGVPRDAPILLRFNRYLRPATAVRQSIRVYSGSEEVGAGFLQPEYDVVERVLVFRRQDNSWLEPGALYTVEFVVPSEESSYGLEAFDGAPLSEGAIPLKFDFRAARAEPPSRPAPPEREPAPVLADVPLFGTCANAACHNAAEAANSDVPRMGLDLATVAGLRSTAIGKVAHQTDLSGKAGVPLENPVRFGVNLPIIDPNRPDNSYLLYKLLRKQANFGADNCKTRYGDLPLLNGDCLYQEDESQRLREWFVRGDAMPRAQPDLDPPEDAALTLQRMREIQAWIRGGAKP